MKPTAIMLMAALGWTAGVGPPSAQTTSEIAEPAWSGPEIVVTASSPPLWKLKEAGSTVWVLGVIEPLPTGMT